MAEPRALAFGAGAAVKCLSTSDMRWYDARVVRVKPESSHPYLIHFQGWHARHDIFVDADAVRCVFPPRVSRAGTPSPRCAGRRTLRRTRRPRLD